MSDNKKYYWLKLKEDFFDEDTIAWIEEQENGKEYCLFYLKLCLKSLRNNGVLIRTVGENFIAYDAKALAKATNTDQDTVMVAMDLFKKIGLIDILETGEIYLNQINELVGKETDKAQLMRKKRAKDKALGNNVTELLPECYPEIELELKLDTDLEKDLEKNDTEPEVQAVLDEFIQNRKQMKSPMTNLAIKKLVNNLKKMGNSKEEQIMILERSITNGWKGIFPLDEKDKQKLKKQIKKDKPEEIPAYMQEFIPEE